MRIHMVGSIFRAAVLVAAFVTGSVLSGLAQTQYVLPNEAVILSFKTTRGKTVFLARDKANRYVVYRFGTAAKIEFTYPSPLRPPQTAFKYSFYLRGGGAANAGLDLNYVSFENGGYRYIIYETYSAEDGEQRIGVKVTALKTGATTDFPGVYSSKKGSLVDLRDMKLMGTSDELFD